VCPMLCFDFDFVYYYHNIVRPLDCDSTVVIVMRVWLIGPNLFHTQKSLGAHIIKYGPRTFS